MIPDTVREICDESFSRCSSLRRVTFGSSSTLERVGGGWLAGTEVEEIMLPDTVREVCNRCFSGCSTRLRVTFGSSLLERLDRRTLSSLRPMGTWVQGNVIEFSGIRIIVDLYSIGRVTLTVQPTDRIEDVKAEIQDVTGLRVEDQKAFLFAGRTLKDGMTIQGCAIQNGSTLCMAYRQEPNLLAPYAKTVRVQRE